MVRSSIGWAVHPGAAVTHAGTDRDVHRSWREEHRLIVHRHAVDEVHQK